MKKILIVDDEPSLRFALSKGIKFLGHETVMAESGTEAVEFCGKDLFDLILLDVRMHDMSGLEALKAIRAEGLNQRTPVIMVTAFSHFEIVEDSIKLGANDYIVKPFQLTTILDKVTKWANMNVEAAWEELKPEQEQLLRMTIRTLDGAFDMVRKGGELPFEQIRETAHQMITVMDKGEIKGVLEAVRHHDNYTFTHSLRVGVCLTLFARQYAGLEKEDLLVITSGGVCHDVGKARTPLKILNKPEELDPDEMKIMMQHVDHTVEILNNTPGIPQPVIDIAWQHHERMDGSGYPRGLKGSQMVIFGKMAAIVDAYAALTDKRAYKPAIDHDEAFEMLNYEPGGLDRDLIREFRETMYESKIEV